VGRIRVGRQRDAKKGETVMIIKSMSKFVIDIKSKLRIRWRVFLLLDELDPTLDDFICFFHHPSETINPQEAVHLSNV
jgi:hypothetical protein